ncbi:MAG: hypothetical protein FJZ59_04215 [Chlamydiae bacterium]|jgi:hypothetical protein|nr:hypothetical protein [Chlamydiota bacterium]
MKKIGLIFTLSLFSISSYFTLSIFHEMQKTEQALFSNLQKELLKEAKKLSLAFQELENLSFLIATTTKQSDLKQVIKPPISSIVELDSQKKFLSGFGYDEDGHVHEINSFILPQTEQDTGWVLIELNANLRTSKASYIIPTNWNTLLVITYNMSTFLNDLRSFNFGFYTYAYIANYNRLQPPPKHSYSPFDRIKNTSFELKFPVLVNWSLVITGNWQDIYPYPISMIHSFFALIFLWGISIIFLFYTILNPSLSKPKALWTISFLFDTLFSLLIIFLFIDLPSTALKTAERTASSRKIQQFFSTDPSTILIPTAVYLDSLTFPNDTSFLISGFISQIYPKDNPMEMGFLFPYQSSEYNLSIKEISRWESSESITLLWHFGLGLTAPFSSKFFPFDKRIAQITIWPKELHKNIVFFPNYVNFTSFNTLENPGLNGRINPVGWSIKTSNFILKNEPPYKFFNPSETDTPITYIFELFLVRDFLGAFLSNILALILCIFVAFLVLFIPRDSLLDSLFATISIFVGLIFIAVTNHSSLREYLEVSSFAYCEYLFISFYTLLLAITIDFILRRPKTLTDFDKNYILAICYWPTLLGSFTLMLTLSIF